MDDAIFGDKQKVIRPSGRPVSRRASLPHRQRRSPPPCPPPFPSQPPSLAARPPPSLGEGMSSSATAGAKQVRSSVDAVSEDVRAAKARVDAKEGDLRAAKDDLRAAQTRLDAAKDDLRAAQGDVRRVEVALDEARKKATKPDRTFSLRLSAGATRAQAVAEVRRLEEELKAKLAAVEEARRGLAATQSAFDAAKPGLEQAVRDAQNQVKEAAVALQNLTGIRAAEFFARELQEPIAFTPGEDYVELVRPSPTEEPPGSDAAAQSQSKKAKSSATSLNAREFKHFMAALIKEWREFEPGKQAWLVNDVGDTTIKRPEEPEALVLPFISERDFVGYWTNPRQATLFALHEIHPDAGFSDAKFPGVKPWGTGVTDENLVIRRDNKQYYVEVTEYKHPNVRFKTDVSVAMLTEMDPPPPNTPGRVAFGNVLKTLVQTYTYMVSDADNTQLYGAFSNWDSWVFFKRAVEDGKEVLYVSPWYDRKSARAAWAYFITLAAANAGVANPKRGEVRQVPEWLYEKKQEKQGEGEGEGGAGSGNVGDESAASGGGNTASSSHGRGGPPQELAALYPDTTTTDALGIDALLYVRPFQLLWETDKSSARRVTVNGRDLVAKIVDFHGTPRHTEWDAETLYELEWNEVRGYHALKSLQGRFVPEFLYHGSDLNQLWATAVTTYEGVSLEQLAERRGGKLPAGVKARAVESLRALHSAGVTHGDVALRNAVWRERDGAVLWVDLERSKLARGDFADAAAFAREAQQEVAWVEELLAGVGEEGLLVEQASVASSSSNRGGAPTSAPDADRDVHSPPLNSASASSLGNKSSPRCDRRVSSKRTKVCPCW